MGRRTDLDILADALRGFERQQASRAKVRMATGWDAEKLGELFAVDVFKTKAPGLRMPG